MSTERHRNREDREYRTLTANCKTGEGIPVYDSTYDPTYVLRTYSTTTKAL